MAYLRNNTVNLLNLHYGIFAFAMNSGGVFYRVFLLKAGISAPLVLVTAAVVLIGRFILRPLVLTVAKRFGLRTVVVFGTLVTALQYPCLAFVHGVDRWLVALIVTSAIGDTFYWTSYHAYFASLGDSEHRGHQVSAREALAAVVGIAAPLIGGWALTTLGPVIAFNVSAGVQVLAALPLLATPNVGIAQSAPGAFKAARHSIMMFFADGWICAGYLFVWQISMFLSLGESFAAFGGAVALAAAVGAVAGVFLGRHIDAGHGGKAVWIAISVLVLTIVMRAASMGPAMAVFAIALGALVYCLYVPTVMTAVYNQAKRSPCSLRFHMATEGGWDAGCAAGSLVAAAFIALGLPLSFAILLSLAGAMAMLVLLRRYYAELEAEPSAVVSD